jgi:two-component system, LytTR family, sensor kinase
MQRVLMQQGYPIALNKKMHRQQTTVLGIRTAEIIGVERKSFSDIYQMDNKWVGKVNKQRLILYLCLGLAYLLLAIPDAYQKEAAIWPAIGNNTWQTLYVTVVNYIFLEYSLAFIRERKSIVVQVVLFLLALWFQAMLCSFGLFAWRAIGIGVGVYTPLKIFKSTAQAVESVAGFGIFSIFFFGIGRHIYNYIRLKRDASRLRIEKQQAELNYLKSQTNPHFLFNTLNNIYSLARIKSDLAPESILRLSKILRFTLYETSGQYICIEQELKIINDYIELEKLRYDESLRVNFNYNVEDMRQAVPPLLLMPLVENAFKHGVSETRNRPFIEIHLSVNQRRLVFIVKNSTELVTGGPGVRESIGLGNLRRQLELLYNDYDLAVEQGPSVFTATLKINLASHV